MNALRTENHRDASPEDSAAPSRIGLIAGWGRYPYIVAEHLRNRGDEVYCLGVKQHADPSLANICTDFDWVGLGRLGAAIRYFRRHGVTRATLAGKIHKHSLIGPLAVFQHFPDLRTLRRFYQHFILSKKDRKDDTLLTGVCDEFASGGVELAPATDLVPELLVPAGQLTRRRISQARKRDIAFGWDVAKSMGGLDVGQSVAVMNRAVVAVEAIEGTDECIRRAGALAKGRFTVVKVAKPKQDMRFDVPTIGMGTLEGMVAAGAAVLAIEAGKTILLDAEQVIDYANRHRIAIVALEADELAADRPHSGTADVASNRAA